MTRKQLTDWITDARLRTFELIADLSDEQLIGPRHPDVNPFLWEIGHVAWFQEKWVLRHAFGGNPVLANGDALYDSSAIAHDLRWTLPLPSREDTLRYLGGVRDAVVDRVRNRDLNPEELYFITLSVFHEDMHAEAFTYTRQTLCYPAPRISSAGGGTPVPKQQASGDVDVPGGMFRLGATPEEPFVFDNEKWAHPVEVRPFAIARRAVTQAEFAAFADDGGYRQPRFWSEEAWQWRESNRAQQPMYWQRQAGGRWLRRDFDRWLPIEPDRAMVHVSWYEAEAYCRWAGRRLPTEIEWEVAAAAEPHTSRGGMRESGANELSDLTRRYPWGESPPAKGRANLDWQGMGCASVSAFPDGDSAFGCRQMIGNVWEWTASTFLPYPGFMADPYKEYSEPWFGTHKVLRGGCWATRARLIRNTWRNFYLPARRDVWAGFRTCAIRP